MSILGQHIPVRILLTAVLVLVVAGGVLVRALPALAPAPLRVLLGAPAAGGVQDWWGTASSSPRRDIVLVARGMAFYLENDPSTPNPAIHVKAGERVRIVLRNRERGMVHDFAVPAVEAALDPVRWNEDGDVTFTAPSTPGTYSYLCRPHAALMRGLVIVDNF
jgi:plastocyanin